MASASWLLSRVIKRRDRIHASLEEAGVGLLLELRSEQNEAISVLEEIFRKA